MCVEVLKENQKGMNAQVVRDAAAVSKCPPGSNQRHPGKSVAPGSMFKEQVRVTVPPGLRLIQEGWEPNVPLFHF